MFRGTRLSPLACSPGPELLTILSCQAEALETRHWAEGEGGWWVCGSWEV